MHMHRVEQNKSALSYVHVYRVMYMYISTMSILLDYKLSYVHVYRVMYMYISTMSILLDYKLSYAHVYRVI